MKIVIGWLMLWGWTFGVKAQIVVYSVPKEIYYSCHNDDFTVKVRQPGGRWQDLYEYKVTVDMDTRSQASMVQFDFEGQVEVLVQKNNGQLRSAVVRPLSKGIVPVIEGNYIRFTLDCPQHLSIECNGDRLHNLHLFANPLETDVPKEGDPGVIYFGAGLHKIEESLRIPSQTTVYLAPGAVVRGQLICDSVKHVKIRGRGMLLNPVQGIEITYSEEVAVDGIAVINPRYNTLTAGQCRDITIRNFKSFSSEGWGDGLDFYCCENVLVEGVFLRNSDDCIAVYGHRWNFYGDVRNHQILNSTLWADIAHPINIGTHGNTKIKGNIMEKLVFRNIDILEHDEDDPDYQGCMAICAGDHNLVRDVIFEDIRVEHIQEGQLFHLRVMFNERYNTGPGRGIEKVVFRNISYTGKYETPWLLEGYDEQRMIKDVVFEGLIINGKKVTSLEEMNVQKKEFVEGIRLK